MNKAFSLWLWQNSPSVNTPLGESKLNLINRALDEVDSRVVNFDTTKANQNDLLTAVADVTYNESTGIFTVTKKNGAKTTIDTKLEKLAINFTYDKTNQRLVITLDDGTIQYVDMKALITELEFLNSDTVLFSVSSDGKVSASIAKGSITADMLEPNYLANVQLYASQALTSADDAAKSAQEAEASAIRAEEAAKNAESIVGGDFASNEKVDNILNGTTPAGNASKLGGLLPSEYMKVTAVESTDTLVSLWDRVPSSGKERFIYVTGFPSDFPTDLLKQSVIDTFLSVTIEKALNIGYYKINGVYGNGTPYHFTAYYNGDMFWRDDVDGGNADTIDGYHASELVKDYVNLPAETDIIAYIDTDSNIPADGYTSKTAKFRVLNSPTVPPIYGHTASNNDWYYEVTKLSNDWIRIEAHDIRSNLIAYRTKTGGTWGEWTSNFLPLTGGTLSDWLKFVSNRGVYNAVASSADTNENIEAFTFMTEYGEYVINVLNATQGKQVNGLWLSKIGGGKLWNINTQLWDAILTNTNVGSYALPIGGGFCTGDFGIDARTGKGYLAFSNYIGNSYICNRIASDSSFRQIGIISKANLSDATSALKYESELGSLEILHTGNSAKVVQATSAPSDTTAVWVDTANKVSKIYKDGAWTALA